MAETKQMNPYVDNLKDRRTVDRLWERYNGGGIGEGDLDTPRARALVTEWQRCQHLSVNVRMKQGLRLAPDRRAQVLEENRYLLSTAVPILKDVSHLLSNIPMILILADADCNILKVLGDPEVINVAERFNIVEGSCWREDVAGNNGLGTAMHYRNPVHVYASEHFCEGWHKWTCAGTPIFDAATKKVIGVVDLTSLDKDYRDDALGLAYSLSSQIQVQMKLQSEAIRIQLINTYLDLTARYPGEALMVTDSTGAIVRMNQRAESLVKGSRIEVRALQAEGIQVQSSEIIVPGRVQPVGRWHLFSRAALTAGRSALERPVLTAFGKFMTSAPELKEMMVRVQRVANSDLTILLTGETGTGKEALADFVHASSRRAAGPFIAVNCGAISKDLFESKLFGYEKGAFTGADPLGRKGFFEAANRGTLFLDEIGEMPLDIQAALLRVLETRKVRRLGSDREVDTDFRVMAATNRPLEEEMTRHRFRSDLYFRLRVSQFTLPPLRERRMDLPLLISYFLQRCCEQYRVQRSLSPDAFSLLERYNWPGNVRELKNLIESLVVQSDSIITVRDLPVQISGLGQGLDAQGRVPARSAPNQGLRQHERKLILEALHQYKQVKLAAKAIGISRSTLYRKFKEYDIEHQEFT